MPTGVAAVRATISGTTPTPSPALASAHTRAYPGVATSTDGVAPIRASTASTSRRAG